MSGGTSDIPTWFYMLEVIIQFLAGLGLLANNQYYYWNVAFLANGFMNFGRAFVLDTSLPPKFEFKSWPYLVNEIGSYWIVLSFIIPPFVDFGYITPIGLYVLDLVVGIIIFIITFYVPYNHMNAIHSVIAACLLPVGFISSIIWLTKHYNNMETILLIIQIICFIIGGRRRFFDKKGRVLDRSKKSRWPWNISCVLISFLRGCMPLCRSI